MDAWSKWLPFPDPRNLDYISAPFGPGVYELRRSDTKKCIIRGKGKNCALRMSSLLPPPLGQGTRKNENKRNYTLKHIKKIEYRCCACSTDKAAKSLESKLNKEKPCLFPT